MNLISIHPPEPSASGHVHVQGTEVRLQDGSKVGAIRKIVLMAEVGELWTAEITCHAKMGVMRGVQARFNTDRPAWWRTLLCRIAGVDIVSTDFESAAQQCRKP